MNAIAALSMILLAAQRAAPQSDLRELHTVVAATEGEVAEAQQQMRVARLRAIHEHQRILQDELDTLDRLQDVLDSDASVVVMPHEVVRLRAQRSLLTSKLEEADDDALALRTQLGADALDAAEAPWPARHALDVRALSEAAQRRAAPGAQEQAAARVELEVSRVARAEHRIDDLAESVQPDLSDCVSTALIDLADGGSMLDVLESLERIADVREEIAALQLERELALTRLRLLTGAGTQSTSRPHIVAGRRA